MLVVAFSLGFMGSLHCAGMCGPLALIFNQAYSGRSKAQILFSGVLYNLGRCVSYASLGLFFGLIGGILAFANLQAVLSILLGIMMIVGFFLSRNLDAFILKTAFGRKVFLPIKSSLGSLLKASSRKSPALVGVINGLLPCGMVYLALAGAMTTQNIERSVLFMVFFGLGTFPMMFFFSVGSNFLSTSWRLQLQKVLPWVSLLFGVFMIYRGLVVEIPKVFDFWNLINHPVMCH